MFPVHIWPAGQGRHTSRPFPGLYVPGGQPSSWLDPRGQNAPGPHSNPVPSALLGAAVFAPPVHTNPASHSPPVTPSGGLGILAPWAQKWPAAQLPVGAVSPGVSQYLPREHSVH